jgi:Uma2 family endonuclease
METKSVAQSWTYEAMRAKLSAESRYELISGELIDTSPSPNSEHQRISWKLGFALLEFLDQNRLGELLHAPIDVIMDKQNVVQPDVLFVSNANLRIITKKCVEGVPDLMVEIISPSSHYRDIVEKSALYERFGVREYWLIDPANRVIEVFSLQNDKYALHAFVAEEGKATSALLEGFEVDSRAIFTSPDSKL